MKYTLMIWTEIPLRIGRISIVTFFIFTGGLTLGCSKDEPSENNPIEVPENTFKEVELTLPESLFADVQKIENGFASHVITDRLVSLVDATPKNASIYLNVYQFFDISVLVAALKKANERNVQLHIMIDNGSHDPGLIADNLAIVNEIKKWGSNVELILVDNDAGNSAINHNKFMLFSTIVTTEKTEKNVLIQTSQNFTGRGPKKLQDAIVLSHEGLYNAYKQYWDNMSTMASVGMVNFNYREYHDPVEKITAFFHPKTRDGLNFGGDTIIEILDDITNPTSATVRVGMSSWSDSRIVIAEKLEQLLDQGATVEIITKNSVGTDLYAKLKQLEQKGAFVKIYNITESTPQKINIHSKFMLIEGQWQGTQTNLVITGSQNYTINALRNNNETTLMFQDHEFYDTYVSHFSLLKELPAICCPE